jgi:hypothetical protein
MEKQTPTYVKVLFAIAIGAIVYLIFALLKSDATVDSHQVGKKIAETDLKIVIRQRDDLQKENDRLRNNVFDRMQREQAAIQERDQYRAELDKSTDRAVVLSRQLKTANGKITSMDTTHYWVMCDSLANEVDRLYILYLQYKDKADAAEAKKDSTKADYVKALDVQNIMYENLYQKYIQLNTLYTALQADYSGMASKLKKANRRARISSLLGLIGIGIGAGTVIIK